MGGGGTLFLAVLAFFKLVLFSKQNRVPQIIIRLGRVIYQKKAFLVMIRAIFRKIPKNFLVSRKAGLKLFNFCSNFELIW